MSRQKQENSQIEVVGARAVYLRNKAEQVSEFVAWLCTERSEFAAVVEANRDTVQRDAPFARAALRRGDIEVYDHFAGLCFDIVTMQFEIELFDAALAPLKSFHENEETLDLSEPATRLLWERFNSDFME